MTEVEENCKVLLIDGDDGFSRKLKIQYAEHCANDGWQRSRKLSNGLKLASSKDFNIILLGLDHDKHSKAEVINIFVKSKINTPVIALLNKSNKPIIEKTQKHGFGDCLIKDEHLEFVLPKVVKREMLRHQQTKQIESVQKGINTFFADAGMIMLVTDIDSGQIINANSLATKAYGYSLKDFRQMHLKQLEISNTDQLDISARDWNSQLNNDNMGERKLHLTSRGEIRYVTLKEIELVFEGKLQKLVVINDLTNFKKQQEEIRFLQQFNTNILDNLPYCITVKTKNKQITYQNQTARKTFGNLTGKTLASVAKANPDLNNLLKAQKELQEKDFAGEVKFDWKDRIYFLSIFEIVDTRTESILSVELARDVTQSERVQEELLKAQRMEAIGNLAGGIAHDFNNLLSGILGYANLIQAVAEENDQVVQYAQVIDETCERASNLTKQLLQFSRQKMHTEEHFDLNIISRYAAKLLRHSIKKEIRLVQRLSSKELPIFGDPAQVQQMIVNIGLNANESMTYGTITLSTKHLTIKDAENHQKLEPGKYGVINIKDSGRAIDAESIKSLLDPFTSSSNNTKPVSLALSVAHAIVKTHAGLIEVESAKDNKKEIVVTVYLPLTKVQEESEKAEEPAEAYTGNETILVIDDEEVIRNLMLTSLSRFGYRVLAASGAEDGLNLFELFKSEIDLVMLDLGLPGIGGGKVFKILKSLDPSTKIILFTGSSSKSRAKELMSDGAAAWITKPISLKRLSKTMREILDK